MKILTGEDIPPALRADGPDARLATDGASCSLWWSGAPPDHGAIGHFEAEDKSAARDLLQEACALLAARGCKAALAPMNGNTWRSYRYATGGMEENARPLFLLEPPAALGRERLLERAGFTPAHYYASYLETLGDCPDPAARLAAAGFAARTLDIARLEAELRLVYDLAALAFRENPFYTELPRESFVRQYLSYREMIAPELVFLAFAGDRLAGFLFCLPDHLAPPAYPATLLIKTLAVSPAYRGRGLGGALMALARRRAFALGYAQAIEALVYRGNASERFCQNADLLREYTLYRKVL
ncbi:MAG: GNAT family N-acetyltransferase [Gracilibacteraceae bacterium]|jgi:ribosomal protein S18 acetylase RimI-like enzyme|nr:GNAT family N-acetyltransferase [Gracilibacteraceae bacterium]